MAFLKVDVFLWLSVRNSDTHSGGFHTYEKTHTQSHTYTHTHIRVCVTELSAPSCRLICFCIRLLSEEASLLPLSANISSLFLLLSLSLPLLFSFSSHFHFLVFHFFISLLSIFLYVGVYFPLSPPHILLAPFSPSSRCSNTVHFFFINLFALTISPPVLVSVFEGVNVSDRRRYGQISSVSEGIKAADT